MDDTPCDRDALSGSSDDNEALISLFMSYAHADDAARARIYDYLVQMNYDCHFDWEDGGGIRTGDNWRSRISRMIEEARGNVIALLSGNSMKAGGVCRDELAIAVNAKNGRVQPVLIAPESTVNVPPSIAHIQWLDMSEWNEREEDGVNFDSWFEERMGLLDDALKNPDFYSFNDEIAELSGKLEVHQNLSKVYSLIAKEFHGRRWLTQEVDTWAKSTDGAQMLVLKGDPGFGKSAWAAHFAHYTDALDYRLAIGVFCERGSEKLTDPKVIVQTIAFALACRDEAYRHELLEIVRDKRNLEGSAKDFFKALLADPLAHSIDGDHENVVIIIDGLDEAGPADGGANQLAQLLGEGIAELPRWLKLLVTTRNVDPVTKELDKAQRGLLCASKNLNDDAHRWDDIEEFVRLKLKGTYGGNPSFEATVQNLKRKSNGDFFYATLVVDALCREGNTMGLEDVESLTPGLEGAVRSWFQWIFGDDDESLDEYEEQYADALGFILVAPKALPVDELPVLLPGWRERKIKRFLGKIRVLTRRGEDDLGNTTIAFNHDFVKRWLVNDEASGDYYVSAQESARLMAEHFYAKAQENRDELTPYEIIYALELLERAGLKKSYDELRRDADFIRRGVDLVRCVWDGPLEGVSTAKRIVIGERLLSCVPADVLEGGAGASPSKELALQKARLLETLEGLYGEVLRVDDQERTARELMSLRRRLVEQLPVKDNIQEYGSAVSNLAALYNGGSYSISDDCEKVKALFLEEAGVLRGLLGESEDEIFIWDELLSVHGRLVRWECANNQTQYEELFAREYIAVTEALVSQRIFREKDPVCCDRLFEPYALLADVYAGRGDISQAIGVLRKGKDFLEERLRFEPEAPSGKHWNPQIIRYENTDGIYHAMMRAIAQHDDGSMAFSICEEWLDFVDGKVWGLTENPRETAGRIESGLMACLGRLYGESTDKERSLISRVEPWLAFLETKLDDTDYLDDPFFAAVTPREVLAELMARAGMYEEANAELAQVRDRLLAMSVDEEHERCRVERVADIANSMARHAQRGGDETGAVECAKQGLEFVRQWLCRKGETLEEGVAAVDREGLGLLTNAYSALITELIAADRLLEACEIAEGQVQLLEMALLQEGDSASAKKPMLSKAYRELIRCCEKVGNIDRAIDVSRAGAQLYANGDTAQAYLLNLEEIERLCRKAGYWDDVRGVSLEALTLAEQAAQEDLRRYADTIIESTMSHAESLLRTVGQDEARAFLRERGKNAPHIYPAIFRTPGNRETVAAKIQSVRRRMDAGEYDDCKIGRQLIDLLSSWPGIGGQDA